MIGTKEGFEETTEELEYTEELPVMRNKEVFYLVQDIILVHTEEMIEE